MSEFGSAEWYDERWQSMPPVMRKIAADTIRKALNEKERDLIRLKHAEYGHDWIHYLIDTTPEQRAQMDALLPEDAPEDAAWPMTFSAHHGFGTAIRNLLRDEEYGAGIRDDDLPQAPYPDWKGEGIGPQCWDDYYTQAIEAAVGLRDV